MIPSESPQENWRQACTLANGAAILCEVERLNENRMCEKRKSGTGSYNFARYYDRAERTEAKGYDRAEVHWQLG